MCGFWSSTLVEPPWIAAQQSSKLSCNTWSILVMSCWGNQFFQSNWKAKSWGFDCLFTWWIRVVRSQSAFLELPKGCAALMNGENLLQYLLKPSPMRVMAFWCPHQDHLPTRTSTRDTHVNKLPMPISPGEPRVRRVYIVKKGKEKLAVLNP